MKKIGFVYSDRFLDHHTPHGHAERAERLLHLTRHLRAKGWWENLVHLVPVPAGPDALRRVHSDAHCAFVKRSSEQGGGMLDEGDTYASAESYQVALLAAGGVCVGIDAVMRGEVDAAFCAVRPPGHHAERDRPMGFCLFNNVAVGARYAQARHGLTRVAILDWDVHHGNGTQHMFEDDPSVLFISLHQFPFYPGTGARDETGIGPGKGFTMNFPMPAGTREGAYVTAFRDEIVPALHSYAPELLMISAGFDAHDDDPLAGLRLTSSSYRVLTEMVRRIAPVVSVLEGGYDLEATASSVEEHLASLASENGSEIGV